MFDVCGDSFTEITTSAGIISSPGYPSYRNQSITCTKKITVPAGKAINIWIVDMLLKTRDPVKG
jgi:hypothetical protein